MSEYFLAVSYICQVDIFSRLAPTHSFQLLNAWNFPQLINRFLQYMGGKERHSHTYLFQDWIQVKDMHLFLCFRYKSHESEVKVSRVILRACFFLIIGWTCNKCITPDSCYDTFCTLQTRNIREHRNELVVMTDMQR